jgi:hypothetical protein
MTEHLKLKAEAAEDLQIISAITQDSIVRVGDINFNKSAGTLTLVLSRFKQEQKNGKTGERTKSGLRFNNVLSLQSQGIDRVDPDAFTVLLSVDFVAGKPKPTGEISLVFSGGGQLKASVEYLETRLIDYADARETNSVPLHPIDD